MLLDGLEDPDDYEAYRNLVTLMARKPVLGAVEAALEVRAAIRQSPRDQPLDDDLYRKLGASFLRFADLGRSAPWPRAVPSRRSRPSPNPCPIVAFRVAYAQDEAFGSYFPDTLEAARGGRGRNSLSSRRSAMSRCPRPSTS